MPSHVDRRHADGRPAAVMPLGIVARPAACLEPPSPVRMPAMASSRWRVAVLTAAGVSAWLAMGVRGVETRASSREAAAPTSVSASTPLQQQPLDVIYVPTPPEVVRQMLLTAKVGPGDVVMDLGSGDGRIPIAAVKDFGATRGIGVELDHQRVLEARANAQAAGVAERVTFLEQDLFTTDLSQATVIAMYLLPRINARLAPVLRALAPGTRIVSHNYDMGPAWKPARSFVVENNLIHFWTVPRR